tara:strand:- start:1330 stop:2670 length:1341 start_codon:yes stop_codon:yes gene_type:complete
MSFLKLNTIIFNLNSIILFILSSILVINFYFIELSFATIFLANIAIFICLIYFFINKQNKNNYFLFQITLYITFLLINIILYFEPLKILEKNHINKINKKYNPNFIYDYRSRSEIYYEDIKENIKPHRFPELNDTNSLHYDFTLSNFSNSTIRHCNENGIWLKYKSDKYGFNNNNQNYGKKVDSIFLGDSFFEAMCVKRKNNTSSLLSKKSKKNIINLSISGSGPLDHLAIFKEYGKSLNPKEVFIFFYEKNDLKDLNKRKNHIKLIKYLDRNFDNYKYIYRIPELDKQLENQFNLYLNKEVAKKEIPIFKSFVNFFTLQKLRIFIQNFYFSYNIDGENYALLKTNSEILSKIFKEFNNLSIKQKFKINFIYVPSSNFIGKNKESKIKDLLFLLVKRDLNPENLIDLEKLLDNHSLNELYPFGLKNRHFSANGHRLISEYLFKEIK